EKLNTDAEYYGGSNVGNQGGVPAEHVPCDGQPYSIAITLPPLATLMFECAE
ncbi:MAG: alpha amylase C-terminal domain-containing protein, partial [Pseudomonadota bacterium]